MILIFWQGIISIHQKDFLEALAKQQSVSKVLLVVEHAISPYRKNMGWEVPEIGGVEIIVSPSIEKIHSVFKEHKDAVHIMGGIRVGKMLSIALDECIKHKCKLGIMTEPYNKANLKGRLRSLKYQYYKSRYSKHIHFVLGIGKQGVAQFARHGFDPARVFPWAYFMSIDSSDEKNDRHGTEEKRIIYAGRIEEGKGIYRFACELIEHSDKNYKLDIYGTGPDEEKIKKLVSTNGIAGKINIYPFLQHDELVKKYSDYDWVVLPSTQKDGWGVIISEGLLNGRKAICSSICGASWVIKDEFNGVTFDWDESDSCRNAIGRIFSDNGFADADTIRTWAVKTISGNAGATYFIKIMDCVYAHKERPGIPWLQT